MSTIRALGLLSGGLDSALATKLLQEQGIEVVGLHLSSPTACRSPIDDVARELGIEVLVRPKGEEYLRLLRNPKHGYGRNMNPCIDCRQFMFESARPHLERVGAGFLFTGEVLGQRPMSQTRDNLLAIDKRANMKGKVLRPLSARLLPETEPERDGRVDRSRLLDIHGRGRQRQIAMAERYGLETPMAPAGGCLLTDPLFSEKLRDLFLFMPEESTTLEDVSLLRVGRHVRLTAECKVVLGRNREENERLRSLAREDRWIVDPDGFSGPTALVCGPQDQDVLARTFELIARYSRIPVEGGRVRWREGGEERYGTIPAPAPAPIA